MNLYYELDKYVMSIDENIEKRTTTVYVGYDIVKSFLEVWMYKEKFNYVFWRL